MEVKRIFFEKTIAPSFELEDGRIKHPRSAMGKLTVWMTDEEWEKYVSRYAELEKEVSILNQIKGLFKKKK